MNQPKAAMRDHRRQLTHLRAHRTFQRQDKHQHARVSWNTVIDKEQSRRHIKEHLNAKINAKCPGFYSPGKMNTDEGQESLVALWRRIRDHHRIGPADGLMVPERLRRRMIKTKYPRLSGEGFVEFMEEINPGTLKPRKGTGITRNSTQPIED